MSLGRYLFTIQVYSFAILKEVTPREEKLAGQENRGPAVVGDHAPGGQGSCALHAGCAAKHLAPLQHQREDQAGVGKRQTCPQEENHVRCLAGGSGAGFTSLCSSCGAGGGSADSEVGSAWGQAQWKCFFP